MLPRGTTQHAFVVLLIAYLALFLITPEMFNSGHIVVPMIYYFMVSMLAGGVIQKSNFLWGILMGCFPYLYGLATGRTSDLNLYLNYYIPLPLVCGTAASFGEAIYRRIVAKGKSNLYTKSRHSE